SDTVEATIGQDNIIISSYEGSIPHQKLFVNGSLVDESTLSELDDGDAGSEQRLGITSFDEALRGSIKEVLVFNKALSDQERMIVTHYLSVKWGLENIIDADGDGVLSEPSLDISGAPLLSQTTFNSTGADQKYTISSDTAFLKVELWGAGGGQTNDMGYAPGGAGGYTESIIIVPTGNNSLTIVVGKGGLRGPNIPEDSYGGGGGSGSNDRSGAQGGGRSAIVLAGADILTAGGGGGGGWGGSWRKGGPGGGLVGIKGQHEVAGLGGTQIAGGENNTGQHSQGEYGGIGNQWQGGKGANWGAGGGGGGYYGGGGGSANDNEKGAGGGGSGFVGRNGTVVLTGNNYGSTTQLMDPEGRLDKVSGVVYFNSRTLMGSLSTLLPVITNGNAGQGYGDSGIVRITAYGGSKYEKDLFPLDATESLDSDNDGIGNNADTDDDGDGVNDDVDAFPYDASETLDTDGDGIGNNADTDDDNDGVNDDVDAFPLDDAETLDTDNDGIGNNADTDDDGDGISDAYEIALGKNPMVADATVYTTKTFAYTGDIQEFIVPNGTTEVEIDAYGAEASSGWNSIGGKGGYVQAILDVTAGEKLYIYIGGSSGFNGGGAGGNYNAKSGAGATDIRQNGNTLQNRVIVAGGGGGVGEQLDADAGGDGGNGGGLVADAGGSGKNQGGNGGAGATQSTGHSLGIGGNGTYSNQYYASGGGGGGYYGGYAGYNKHYKAGGGGGGGSSYAFPTDINVIHKKGANTGNGSLTIKYKRLDLPYITSHSHLFVTENTTIIDTLTSVKTVTWSLTGGTDQNSLNINQNSGELSFVNAPNYELPQDADNNNQYVIEVKATDTSDSSLISTQSITITVTNDPTDPHLVRDSNGVTIQLFNGNSTNVGQQLMVDGESPSALYTIANNHYLDTIKNGIGSSHSDADFVSINTTLVTTMNELFKNNLDFNGDISHYDVSNVTTMEGLFYGESGNHNFNQNIGNWNVNNVTNMKNAFNGATVFNQNIGSWDVSNVINMDHMFNNASSFAQNLSAWDVSNVGLQPANFNTGATHFTSNLPIWGTTGTAPIITIDTENGNNFILSSTDPTISIGDGY
ncbi:MAG: glycine-rich protein, partial [Candidatus Margulisiibacteriota bacterium]